MLLNLKIENIAVIESAGLEFGKGLNVLTGETGAGKSIVIDSVNAVLGERTSRELIRDGSDSAKVSAVFTDIGKETEETLDSFGIETTGDGTMTVSRSITSGGKNTCLVNGWPVTVTQLRAIGNTLINIHGQHDGQALLNPEKHCGYIDALAGNEELLAEYKDAFHKLIATKKELDALYDKRDENLSRIDYLDYVIKELEDAGIKEGETEQLNKEKKLLENSVNVKKLLEKAYQSLGGDGGLSESLSECAAQVEKAAEFYDEATGPAKQIRGLSFELSDATAVLRNLSESFTYSPSRISEIDSRLDEIYRLSMKYGKTEADMLATLSNAIDEKSKAVSSDERISVLEDELYKHSDNVKKLASKLSETRRKNALIFEKKVSEELKFLDMPHVRFKAEIKETPMSSKGAETIEFLISTNPGQEPRAIAKTASGGELSRIMLAIKNVLSSSDTVGTLIFDEIDAGVSGSAAEKIALKLQQVAEGKQVICVTHLARIAAQADIHFKIEKAFRNGGTYTSVVPLDFDGRAAEIARITAGTGITELQLDTAKEMLENAKGNKI